MDVKGDKPSYNFLTKAS